MGFRTPTGFAPLFRLDRDDGALVLIAVWNGRAEYENHPPTDMIDELGALGRVIIAQICRPVGVNGRSALRTSREIADTGAGVVVHWARNNATFHSIVEECRSAGLMPIDRRASYPAWRVSRPGHA
jgi:hypothetical protein